MTAATALYPHAYITPEIGGATLNPQTGAAVIAGETEAYAVALGPQYEATIGPDEFFAGAQAQADILTDYAARYADELARPGIYLGVYYSEATGLVYLDLAEIVRDRAAAIRLGTLRAQESVFAFHTFETIYLDTERGRAARLTL
jgi:hypothetical protein